MTLGVNDLILIDTNVLIHWVRQDATGEHLLHEYSLNQRAERPLLSTVVEGEIRALAKFWGWGAGKLKQLDRILGQLVRVDAGIPDVVRCYADLYVQDRNGGRNTGQNDLWIAATARATGAILLTTDGDFSWMHPELLQVELIKIRP